MRSAARHRVTATGTTFLLTLLAIAAALTIGPTTATSIGSTTTQKWADTNVHMNVLSASTISTAGCGPLVSGITDFGDAQVGDNAITGTDCAVTFGSSNDTAFLKVFQTDQYGAASWQHGFGDLDTTFATAGKRSTDTVGTGADEPFGAIEGSAGTFYVAGYLDNGTDDDVFVLRYDRLGALDNTWSGDGRAIVDYDGTNSDELVNFRSDSLAVQSDGKVLVAASTSAVPSAIVMVARFETDGDLDPTWGGDGIATFGVGGYQLAHTVEVLPSGLVVAAGNSNCYYRFTATGAADTSFDGDGAVCRVVGTSSAHSLEIQPDGKMVTAGITWNGSDYDLLLQRVTAAGALDGTFGTGGNKTVTIAAGNEYLNEVDLMSDGRMVACGYITGSNTDAFIGRFEADGDLDPTFGGGDGYDIIDQANPTSFGNCRVQYDGKIIASGGATPGATGVDHMIARYTAAGVLDTTFDTDGIKYVSMVNGGDSSRGLAITDDGKIVVAGMATNATNDVSILKLDSFPINNFDDDNAGNDYNWSEGASMFGACLHTVANNASGGGANGWTVAGSGNCTSALNANWNPIVATAGTAGSRVATSLVSQTTNATANLRFGIRTGNGQAPGTYLAPITFEVEAPNV